MIIYIVGNVFLIDDIWRETFILQWTHTSMSTITTETYFWWIENGTVVCKYNRAHVTHTTVTCFNSLFFLSKCLCNNLKNIIPMSVLTFFEYGGLSKIIFRFSFLFIITFFWNFRFNIIQFISKTTLFLTLLGMAEYFLKRLFHLMINLIISC